MLRLHVAFVTLERRRQKVFARWHVAPLVRMTVHVLCVDAKRKIYFGAHVLIQLAASPTWCPLPLGYLLGRAVELRLDVGA